MRLLGFSSFKRWKGKWQHQKEKDTERSGRGQIKCGNSVTHNFRIINYHPHNYAVVVSRGEDIINAETLIDDNYIFTRVALEGKIVLLIFM